MLNIDVMFNSRLIISPKAKDRINYLTNTLKDLGLKIGHPDVLYFDLDDKLGVEQAKQVREFLSLKPYSAFERAAVFADAGKLTTEAQNALLKTLEEPPLQALLLLGVNSAEVLLPTIMSRCQSIYINGSAEDEEKGLYYDDIKKLIASTPEQRFEYIEKLEDKKEEFLKALVSYYRKNLRENPEAVGFTGALLEAEHWIKSNVNSRAVLEYLMLELPK